MPANPQARFMNRRSGAQPVALQSSYRDVDHQLWITLNQSPSPRPIPKAAFKYKDCEPSNYSLEAGVDGYFQELEWGLDPDWYRRKTHWRAWIPHAVPLEWYDMHSNPISNETISTTGRNPSIPPSHIQLIQQDLKDADCILRKLIKRAQDDVHKEVSCPFPPPVQIDDLRAPFESRSLLLQCLCRVQRGFLEILGAIRWIIAWDNDIDTHLGYVKSDVARMGINLEKKFADWDLRQPGGRGVLVDLARDWMEVNIALYVDHEIPVHYVWTPELQLDPRFRSLSPAFLGVAGEGLLSRPLPNWVERTSEPLVTTHRADQFLQLHYPPCAPVRLSQPVKLQNFVVDFEGWKPRNIFGAEKKRYMTELWFEEVSGNSNGRAWSRRIFQRCRPKKDIYDFYLQTENIHVTRELHKFAYCPPPFYRYTSPMYQECEHVTGSSIPSTGPHSLVLPTPKPPPFNIEDDIGSPLDIAMGNNSMSMPPPLKDLVELPQEPSISSFSRHLVPNACNSFRRPQLPHQPPFRNSQSYRWNPSHPHTAISSKRKYPDNHGESSFDRRQRQRPLAIEPPLSDARARGTARDTIATNVGTVEPMPVDSCLVGLQGSSGSEVCPSWEESGNHAAKKSSGWESQPSGGRRTSFTSGESSSLSAWGILGGSNEWRDLQSVNSWTVAPEPGRGSGPRGECEPPESMCDAPGQVDSGNTGSASSWSPAERQGSPPPPMAPSGYQRPNPANPPPKRTRLHPRNYPRMTALPSRAFTERQGTSSQPAIPCYPASTSPLVNRPPSPIIDHRTAHGKAPDSSVHSSTALVPDLVSVTPSVRERIITIMQQWVSSAPAIETSRVNWNPSLLTRAILVVDSVAETRIRYQALVNAQRTLQDILDDALQRGIPFELGLNHKELVSLAPNSLPPREPFYATGFQDQPLQWTNPLSFYTAWQEAASRIFSRPHARAYLFKGGLLWRLARLLGPPTLMQSAAQGFSVAATCYGRHQPVRSDSPILVEESSYYEISLILGMTTIGGCTKWLWPPDDVFKTLHCWTGEWNEECEGWFQTKLKGVKAGAQPRTCFQWERDSRFRRRDRIDHVAATAPALTLFRTASGCSWDGLDVRDIILPG